YFFIFFRLPNFFVLSHRHGTPTFRASIGTTCPMLWRLCLPTPMPPIERFQKKFARYRRTRYLCPRHSVACVSFQFLLGWSWFIKKRRETGSMTRWQPSIMVSIRCQFLSPVGEYIN